MPAASVTAVCAEKLWLAVIREIYREFYDQAGYSPVSYAKWLNEIDPLPHNSLQNRTGNFFGWIRELGFANRELPIERVAFELVVVLMRASKRAAASLLRFAALKVVECEQDLSGLAP
jgi:hypothetical protein